MLTRAVKHLHNPSNSVRFAFTVIALALLLAAVVAAPLTWDGAYYLLKMLDSGEPIIAQGRLADKYLHYPVVWIMGITDSQSVISLVFSVIHVITPLLALMLSWWVVKDRYSFLIIWPMLAIGMALLPGQINFISEGIKADQLMWPLLLAVVVGAPRRTMPLIALLAVSIYYLHPVSSPILAAVGLAAINLAVIKPVDRWRLIIVGLPLLIAGGYRYRGISSGYEQSEMTWETQQRQWANGAAGLPTVAIICGAIIAISILIQPWIPASRRRIVIGVQLAAITASTIALTIWAAQPSQWWDALEFRGPAFWISMITAGCLFLNVVIDHFVEPDRRFPAIPVVAISVGFSVVLVVQSLAWNGVVRGINDQLQASTQACLAREDLAGYPYTPLNLWSTNALSLLNQGDTPSKVSMTAAECHDAKTSGRIAMDTGDFASWSQSFDVSALKTNLTEATACTWIHTEGWHQAEALIPDAWRWTGSSGTIAIAMEEPASIVISGEFRTIEAPNTVRLLMNGSEIGAFDLDGTGSDAFALTPIELPAGTSIITFVSENEAVVPPNDGRPLAMSMWNPDIRPADGSSPCLQQDAP